MQIACHLLRIPLKRIQSVPPTHIPTPTQTWQYRIQSPFPYAIPGPFPSNFSMSFRRPVPFVQKNGRSCRFP